jgi:hypothetical protein
MTMMQASAMNNGGATTVGVIKPTHLNPTTQVNGREPTTPPNEAEPTKFVHLYVLTNTKTRKLYSLHRRHYTTILLLLLYAFTLITMETDASMSDASMSTKRSASPLARKNQKKVTQGTSLIKRISFLEVPTEEDIVPTTTNHNIATSGLKDLNESTLALAQTPYERMLGQDMGDQAAFHDDLISMSIPGNGFMTRRHWHKIS